jgi:hypothetical protein
MPAPRRRAHEDDDLHVRDAHEGKQRGRANLCESTPLSSPRTFLARRVSRERVSA